MSRFITLFLLFATVLILASTYVLGMLRRMFGAIPREGPTRRPPNNVSEDVLYKANDVEVLRGSSTKTKKVRSAQKSQ